MFFYNCSVFDYSTVAGRKSQINLTVIVIVNSLAGSRTNCSCADERHLTAEERLIDQLFRHYDVDSRGVVNASSTVTVEIQLLLMRVQRLVSHRVQ